MAEMNVAMTADRHVPSVSTRAPDADDRPDHRGAQELAAPRRGARPSFWRMSPPRAGIPADHQESHHDHDQRHQLRRAGLGHPRVIADQ